ncbi:hypothetical protein [Streptomyces pinistramenti]|uniref:hypothetical protein n=1 Tax=Streptomyces pinistramenti TaxID=2884812 RepID=UPI001D06BBCD|nr:hypothetical protein [Streptomyces pinistramenti]MCB5907085.1 hypothetical protein [Streptomyces pinistramenti]
MSRRDDAVGCPECERLTAELSAAERAGDASKAVDCRVLLRRHPQHDAFPVELRGSDDR